MWLSLQSQSSSGRYSSRVKTRAGFLAAALFLLRAPLVQAALPTAEHNALVDLYNSTNGASWTNNTNWLVAADECTWFGVTCNVEETQVIRLGLESNNLSGTLPASLGILTGVTGSFIRRPAERTELVDARRHPPQARMEPVARVHVVARRAVVEFRSSGSLN